MKHALVTGAAGFVGSHLTSELLSRGWAVTAVDCLTPYYSPQTKRANANVFLNDPGCSYHEYDLLDVPLDDLLRGVDVVFHLAAQAGVRASWGSTFDAYTRNNITLVQRMLEAARGADLERFVFASSSSVYGDAEMLPTPEDLVLRPVSPYGATKALGEHLVQIYARTFAVPALSLRYFTIYGPRQRPDMAFYRLIEAASTGREFTLYGDGTQTRDFTFIDDAVIGTIAAAELGVAGATYNLGGGARTSMADVVEVIGDLVAPVRVRRETAGLGDARDTAADIARAREDLAFAPSTHLREGLALQASWQLTREGLHEA